MSDLITAIHEFVQNNAVIISAGILILAYIFIAIEKISKVTVALIGAGLTILFGLVAQSKGHDIIINEVSIDDVLLFPKHP